VGTSFPSLLSTRPNSSQRAIENDANASPQAFLDFSPSSLPLCSAKHIAHPAWKRWDGVDDQLEELSEHVTAYVNAVAYASSQRLGWVIGLCGCLCISVAPTRGGSAQQCRSRQLPNPTLVQRIMVQAQPHPHLYTSLVVTASQPDLSLFHSAKAAKACSHPHKSSRHYTHRCSFSYACSVFTFVFVFGYTVFAIWL